MSVQTETIPHTFMRIWLDEPVPERYEEFWDGFQDDHPFWNFRTFNDSSKLTWMRPEIRRIFDLCKTHAGRSDVLRYEAIWHFGGVYVDCDVECLRPFDDLTATDKLVTGWEDDRMICPTVIAAPPEHPAMGAVLEALTPWFLTHQFDPPNMSTGPHLFTRILRWRDDVTLLGPHTFYPVHWSSKKDLGGPYPEESYAVHHWDARWLPGGPPQRD